MNSVRISACAAEVNTIIWFNKWTLWQGGRASKPITSNNNPPLLCPSVHQTATESSKATQSLGVLQEPWEPKEGS